MSRYILYSSLYPLFIDEMNGWGVAHSRLYRTEDGGKNWFLKNYVGGASLVLSKNAGNEVFLYSRGDGSFGSDNVFVKVTDNTIPTYPGNIYGEREAVAGNTYKYSVVKLSHLGYEWSVAGGKIVEYQGHEVVVQWEAEREKQLFLTVNDPCGRQRHLTIRVNEIEGRDFEDSEGEEPVTALPKDKSATMSVYPNPTASLLYLDAGKLLPVDASIEIHNLSGQMVYVKKLESVSRIEEHVYALNLFFLQPGFYVVRVHSSKEVISFKILKL